MGTMKAYKAYDKTECFYSTVVFAETSGKARSEATRTDTCEDVPFTDIRVLRVPELDGAYRGFSEMDWYNDIDRRAMVAVGWKCWEPMDYECEACCARDICTHVDGEEDY